MTEAKKIALTPGYRAQRVLHMDFNEDLFAGFLAEQLSRLPTDSQVTAMVEILTILNQFVQMHAEAQYSAI